MCEAGRRLLLSGGSTITANLGGSCTKTAPFSLALSSSFEGDDSLEVIGLSSEFLVSSDFIVSLFAESDTGTAAVLEADSGADAVLEADSGAVAVLEADSGAVAVLEADSGAVAVLEADSGAVAVLEADSGAVTVLEADSGTGAVLEADSGAVAVLEADSGTDTVLEADSGADTVLETDTGTGAVAPDSGTGSLESDLTLESDVSIFVSSVGLVARVSVACELTAGMSSGILYVPLISVYCSICGKQQERLKLYGYRRTDMAKSLFTCVYKALVWTNKGLGNMMLETLHVA